MKAGSKATLGFNHLLLSRKPSPFVYQFPIATAKSYHKCGDLKYTHIHYLTVLKARSPDWVSLAKTSCWQGYVPSGGPRGESFLGFPVLRGHQYPLAYSAFPYL